MADGKYYWLRLKEDFFTRHDILYLEDRPNGAKIVLFYLKLMTESIDHEGRLRFSDNRPYTREMLATITRTDIAIVEEAMDLLYELELLECDEDKTLILPKVPDLIGFETEWAKKKRDYRDKITEEKKGQDEDTKGQDEDKARTMSSQSPPKVRQEIEKEKEIEKELYLKENVKEKTSRFSPPTLEEIQAYIREKGFSVDAERFFDYYTSNGWKVGKNPMKSWEATVRNWARDSKQEEPKPKGAVSYDLERVKERANQPIVYKPKAERNTPTRNTGSADIQNEHDNHNAREYDAELKRKIAALHNNGGT